MAVTAEAFLAMPQTPYAQVRDQLQTGDIALFHSVNLGSEIIELGTGSLWSHAALVWRLPSVDRVMLLESMDTVGVRVMPLSTRINGCSAAPTPFNGKLLIARHDDFPDPPPPDKLHHMTQFALDRVGFPYSFHELHQIALRIALGMAGKIVTGRLEPTDGYICSEYVARCFSAIGVELAPDQKGFIAPADIADDPKVRALYSVRPDPGPEV
jgi:hypothetical protein